MPAIGFVRPEALWLLVPVALLAALAVFVEIRRRRAVAIFAGRGVELASVSGARRRLKAALAVAALAFTSVAASGPYLDVVERTVVQSGVDLVIALDVSQSMAARDVDPDRLRAGRDFVQRLGDGLTQSRVALVLFAGQGVVRYPTTSDPAVLGRTLDSINAAFKPQQGGSSLAGAVNAALAAFSSEARESARRKAVVLITDGEDTLSSAPDVDALKRANVKLLAVGVGTPSGGPIPTYDRNGRFTGFLKRADGSQIITRLDENALKSLTERTEGRYWRLQPGRGTVNDVITELERLDASQLGDLPGGSVPNDRYQTLLAIGILLLVAEALLSDRRPMPHPRGLRTPRPRGRFPLPAFARVVTLMLAAALVSGACAQTSSADADRLYLAGDVQAALDRYTQLAETHPDISELHVNKGNALHQLARYPAAIDAYQVAIRDGESHVRAVAHYQRGNTLYRMGKLEDARDAYKAALRLDPNDRDAKFNIELVERALAPKIQVPGLPQPGRSQQPGSPTDPGGQQPPSNSSDPNGPPDNAQPGTVGPQASGAPTTDSTQPGPALNEALRQFRSTLTPEEALRLLDALLRDQKGVQILIEGQPQGSPAPGQKPQDPSY